MFPRGKAVLAEIASCLGPAPQRVAVVGPPALAQVLARAGHLVFALGQRVDRLLAARQRLARSQGSTFAVLRVVLAQLPLGDGALDAFVYAGALPAAAGLVVAAWEPALRHGGRVVLAGSVRAGLGARLRARLGGARLAPLRPEDYTRLLLCGGFTEVTQVWPRSTIVITAATARKLPA